MSTVAVIDYGSGNLRSAAKAFERAAAELGRNDRVLVTADPEIVAAADRVVLPGVGAYRDCRDGVLNIDGMMAALTHTVIDRAQPFLGICVGMQLMVSRGLERGSHKGFDWIAGEARTFSFAKPAGPARLKIPHMGWNELRLPASGVHPVLSNLPEPRFAYFLHSYHVALPTTDAVVATTDYGGDVTAAIAKDNLFGTQFHPEKSQGLGLALIRNFLAWRP